MPLRDVFRDLEPVLLVCNGGIPGIQQGLNEVLSFLACGGELSPLGGGRHSALVGIHVTYEERRGRGIVGDKPCSRAV